MDQELIFRTLFFIIFLMGFVVRGYYDRRSRIIGKRQPIWKRWKKPANIEGKANVVLWIIHNAYWLIAVALYLLASPWMPWSSLPLPDWLRWIGVGLAIMSIPFLIWVQRTLGKYWHPYLELRDDHVLITSGPYERIRHPMYTVFILTSLGMMLTSANLLLLIQLIFGIILIIARVGKEEKMLMERFGDEYITYMKRTGRFLPRLSR
jgi:protein-S-isoprenylcysteine O-methyltransferase Ste14